MERRWRNSPAEETAPSSDVSSADHRLAAARQRRAVQRKAERAGTPNAKTAIPEGGGAPLPAQQQRRFGAALGTDLSAVRVHTDGDSADSARQLKARAFTVGNDVHFASNHYAPGTVEGDRLLAHELTHVMQGGGQARCKPEALDVSEPGDAAEREADQVADDAVARLDRPQAGAAARVHAGSSAAIHRSAESDAGAEAPQPEKSPEEQEAEHEATEERLLLLPTADPHDPEQCERIKRLRPTVAMNVARFPDNQAIRALAQALDQAQQAMCAAAKEALTTMSAEIGGINAQQPDAAEKLGELEKDFATWAQHDIVGKTQPFAPTLQYLQVKMALNRKKRETQPPAQGPQPPDLPVPDFSDGAETEDPEPSAEADLTEDPLNHSPERINALARMRAMVRVAKILDEIRQLKEGGKLRVVLDMLPVLSQLQGAVTGIKRLGDSIQERLLVKHLEMLPDAELELELQTWQEHLPTFANLLADNAAELEQLQAILGIGDQLGAGTARERDDAATQTTHTKRDLAISIGAAGIAKLIKMIPTLGPMLAGQSTALAGAHLRLKLAQDELKQLELAATNTRQAP